MAFKESLGFSFECPYGLMHLAQSLSILSLAFGWLWKPRCISRYEYLGDGGWLINVNIHA
jgi:hypothetical protein